MVDFNTLNDRGPAVYRFEALSSHYHWEEPSWSEVIYKGYILEDCIRQADHLRSKIFRLGVRVIEIGSNKVVYEAKERGFGDRVQGIRL